MTESEVRQMLENYRTDSANLEWWFEHKKFETLEEFIEGESLGAVDYGADKVQTSKEPDKSGIGLMCRMRKEYSKDEPDELIEKMYADKLRLHRLDCAVYELPSIPQAIVRMRYYQGKSILDVQNHFCYAERTVKYIVRRSIRTISERIEI